MTFSVDHNLLTPGIYVSRVDKDLPGMQSTYGIVTYDIRLRKPYIDYLLDIGVLHTIEHVLSIALRQAFKGTGISVIYEGAMACQTGLYFVMQGSLPKLLDPELIGSTLSVAMEIALSMDKVPAKSQKECGNYHSLLEIKDIAPELSLMRNFADTVRVTKTFDEYPYIK